jgi:hypothetical protein
MHAGGIVGDLDHQRRLALHLVDRGCQQRHELRVDQHRLGPAMVEDIGHRGDIEPDVDRVQHRTRRRHAKGGFALRGDVGQEGGDHIARFDAAPRQGRGEARHPVVVVGIGHAACAIDPGLAPGEHPRRAVEMRQRRQRHMVGWGFAQPGLVGHPAHGDPPLRSSCQYGGAAGRCNGAAGLGGADRSRSSAVGPYAAAARPSP